MKDGMDGIRVAIRIRNTRKAEKDSNPVDRRRSSQTITTILAPAVRDSRAQGVRKDHREDVVVAALRIPGVRTEVAVVVPFPDSKNNRIGRRTRNTTKNAITTEAKITIITTKIIAKTRVPITAVPRGVAEARVVEVEAKRGGVVHSVEVELVAVPRGEERAAKTHLEDLEVGDPDGARSNGCWCIVGLLTFYNLRCDRS